MRKTNYLKRATKRFLQGTHCISPVQAVESGKRSLAEWAALLAEERELDTAMMLGRSGHKRLLPSHAPRSAA